MGVVKHTYLGMNVTNYEQNVIEKFDKKVIPETVVSYLCLEMFAVVGYLHQCGIIHSALKPAHFLLRVTG